MSLCVASVLCVVSVLRVCLYVCLCVCCASIFCSSVCWVCMDACVVCGALCVVCFTSCFVCCVLCERALGVRALFVCFVFVSLCVCGISSSPKCSRAVSSSALLLCFACRLQARVRSETTSPPLCVSGSSLALVSCCRDGHKAVSVVT